MHHVHAGLAAGGPPGRLQVQVRVHHVPCDTTELCTRRFGAETSKPDVGQPRLKALLRLRQVPFFFAKKAPLVELRLPSKGREREEGGVERPLRSPQGAVGGRCKGPSGRSKGPGTGRYPPPKGPSAVTRAPVARTTAP